MFIMEISAMEKKMVLVEYNFKIKLYMRGHGSKTNYRELVHYILKI